MGIMVTYGSYMKQEVDLEKSVRHIEIFDTGIAFLAGLMIIPAVFAFSGGEDSINAGPGLMFSTLPKVFGEMPLGEVFGAVFFILVFFAALTSSISLMETVVSICQDKFHWKRKTTCLIVMIGALLVGIPSSLGFGVWKNFQPLGMSILDFFDFLSNSVLMPIVALLISLFVGYVIGTKTISEEVRKSSAFHGEKLFIVVIKYIAPICIVAILISSVLDDLKLFVI